MINLFFIRHGQTDWNKEGKLQGIIDIPLNYTGISEANLLKESLDLEYNYIISSPLKRAYKTAEIINIHSKKIVVDKRLQERNFGNLAGKSSSFVKAITDSGELNDSVEHLDQFILKIKDFLDSCLLLDYGNYLVVTHGGVIISLLNYLSDGEANWENTPISNCSLTSISYEKKWKINFLNREVNYKLYNTIKS